MSCDPASEINLLLGRARLASGRLKNRIRYLCYEGILDMATAADLQALIGQIDTATSAIASRIQALIAQIPAPGTTISQADSDSLKAALQAEADKLTALGSDPSNPVPAGS